MKLTEPQLEALRRLAAASVTSEPTLWDLPKQTVSALATRGLVTAETFVHKGRYGRCGWETRSSGMKYLVDVGARITSAGLAALHAATRPNRPRGRVRRRRIR